MRSSIDRSATWLPSLGNYPAMQVCVDEPDFFTFGALPDDEVDVVVDFDPTEGDVDLELFGPSGDLVDSAFGPGAPEILSAGESPGGIYTLGVYLSADFGSKDGINYDLDLLIIPPPGR